MTQYLLSAHVSIWEQELWVRTTRRPPTSQTPPSAQLGPCLWSKIYKRLLNDIVGGDFDKKGKPYLTERVLALRITLGTAIIQHDVGKLSCTSLGPTSSHSHSQQGTIDDVVFTFFVEAQTLFVTVHISQPFSIIAPPHWIAARIQNTDMMSCDISSTNSSESPVNDQLTAASPPWFQLLGWRGKQPASNKTHITVLVGPEPSSSPCSHHWAARSQPPFDFFDPSDAGRDTPTRQGQNGIRRTRSDVLHGGGRNSQLDAFLM